MRMEKWNDCQSWAVGCDLVRHNLRLMLVVHRHNLRLTLVVHRYIIIVKDDIYSILPLLIPDLCNQTANVRCIRDVQFCADFFNQLRVGLVKRRMDLRKFVWASTEKNSYWRLD
jgi:hypothetical protein